MPIYEFGCADCGHEFEKIQSFSDTSTPACPRCQSVRVQRRLSPPAIHFKGSGWYVTDSKNGNKSSAKAEPESTDKGTTKAEGTSAESTNSSDTDKNTADKSATDKTSADKSTPKKTESAPAKEAA
jgi:putative FmdB family regulatory protein